MAHNTDPDPTNHRHGTDTAAKDGSACQLTCLERPRPLGGPSLNRPGDASGSGAARTCPRPPLRECGSAGVRCVLAAVFLFTLAGCGSTHSRLPAGAIALRPLPAQGLIAQERGGVALRDLHGRSLAWLPRFSLYP